MSIRRGIHYALRMSNLSLTPGWLRRSAGLLRSLIIYRHPFRQRGLRRLYKPFVRSGGLAFDVGAHLGDRTRAFSSLGCRVVACEPQPHLRAWLLRLEGRRPGVTISAAAVGAEPGWAELAISQATPTVSTLATSWRRGIGAANETFSRVRWEERIEVPVITLDELIREHGLPDFCKIDVEGYEEAVLQGVSQPLPALSIEFVAGSLDDTERCVKRLEALLAQAPEPSRYRYNVVPGEGRRFLFGAWQAPEDLLGWLARGAGGYSSGDVYARLELS